MRQIIHRHIGVRAEGMILAAGLWGLIGIGTLTGQSLDRPGAWHALLPTGIRVTLWLGAAIAALITACSVRWSPLGLGLLTVAPMIYLVSYLSAWVLELIPGPPPGDPGGWYRASIYAVLVAFVVLLSHIPATVRAPLAGRAR